MQKLAPLFPLNSSVNKNNIMSLVITIIIYVVVAAVIGFVLKYLVGIPLVGLIFRIISTLVWIYEVVGIVLAIYTFIK